MKNTLFTVHRCANPSTKVLGILKLALRTTSDTFVRSKFLNAFLALTILFFGAATTSGQGLVTLLPSNTIYTSGQSHDIQKIANDVHTSDYRLVQLGSFASNQVNGLLSFSIPGMENGSFTGQVELIENDNNGGTAWSGSIAGDPGSYFAFGSNAFSSTIPNA